MRTCARARACGVGVRVCTCVYGYVRVYKCTCTCVYVHVFVRVWPRGPGSVNLDSVFTRPTQAYVGMLVVINYSRHKKKNNI